MPVEELKGFLPNECQGSVTQTSGVACLKGLQPIHCLWLFTLSPMMALGHLEECTLDGLFPLDLKIYS